ncbi:unnamed protein product, partial [Notodromas monacha]
MVLGCVLEEARIKRPLLAVFYNDRVDTLADLSENIVNVPMTVHLQEKKQFKRPIFSAKKCFARPRGSVIFKTRTTHLHNEF